MLYEDRKPRLVFLRPCATHHVTTLSLPESLTVSLHFVYPNPAFLLTIHVRMAWQLIASCQ